MLHGSVVAEARPACPERMQFFFSVSEETLEMNLLCVGGSSLPLSSFQGRSF